MLARHPEVETGFFNNIDPKRTSPIGIALSLISRGEPLKSRYRTTPLRALWDMQKIHKDGFYHDGRFPTLLDVVQHYDRHFGLGLTGEEVRNLIEYLKSI